MLSGGFCGIIKKRRSATTEVSAYERCIFDAKENGSVAFFYIKKQPDLKNFQIILFFLKRNAFFVVFIGVGTVHKKRRTV